MRNFNLSVAATDRFMAAAAAGERFALVNPRTGVVVRELEASAVLDLIATAAWTSGDPGMVFIDRVEATNPTPALGAIEATNPCGEQPLLPFEACTLGSIDLGRFASSGAIEWEALRACIHDAVRFLDDVVEANQYPLPAIAAATRATRKIGLGVMGLADLFIELGVPYDDPRALEIGEQIAAFFEQESVAASVALAVERGPFPAFARSRWAVAGHAPLRNATTTTVAPTGTISIIAGCSSGIEPLYAVAYERNVLEGEVLPSCTRGLRDARRRWGSWTRRSLRPSGDEAVSAAWLAFPTTFSGCLRRRTTFRSSSTSGSRHSSSVTSTPRSRRRSTFRTTRRRPTSAGRTSSRTRSGARESRSTGTVRAALRC
jgi:ribonucleoside-diphosphate reductase alpha chain